MSYRVGYIGIYSIVSFWILLGDIVGWWTPPIAWMHVYGQTANRMIDEQWSFDPWSFFLFFLTMRNDDILSLFAVLSDWMGGKQWVKLLKPKDQFGEDIEKEGN